MEQCLSLCRCQVEQEEEYALNTIARGIDYTDVNLEIENIQDGELEMGLESSNSNPATYYEAASFVSDIPELDEDSESENRSGSRLLEYIGNGIVRMIYSPIEFLDNNMSDSSEELLGSPVLPTNPESEAVVNVYDLNGQIRNQINNVSENRNRSRLQEYMGMGGEIGRNSIYSLVEFLDSIMPDSTEELWGLLSVSLSDPEPEPEDNIYDMNRQVVNHRNNDEINNLISNIIQDNYTLTSVMNLQQIAETESRWLAVVTSLMYFIPTGISWWAGYIGFLVKNLTIPSKENAINAIRFLKPPSPYKVENVCVIIGSLADLFTGQHLAILINSETMITLISYLNVKEHPLIILHSLIALEKLARTAENKMSITKGMKSHLVHPLVNLEYWADNKDFIKRQVGFNAKWLLDNIFLVSGRLFGFQRVYNNSKICVTLNANEATPYLKISPDGLEARNDSTTLETVRCTYKVISGVWYYESLIVTDGRMQIGWATNDPKNQNLVGFGPGIGMDEYSVGIDGNFVTLFYNGTRSPLNIHSKWAAGDILGTSIDFDNRIILFYLNGKIIGVHKEIFNKSQSGFYAAASFWSFEQCRFNFGSIPLRFPPLGKWFSTFNEVQLTASGLNQHQLILPKHLSRTEFLRNLKPHENPCQLCFDHEADTMILPCRHSEMCYICVQLLTTCPYCRESIADKITRLEVSKT